MLKESFGRLMAKPVTRREFLGYAGAIVLGIVGVSALLRSMSEVTSRSTSKSTASPISKKSASNPLIPPTPVDHGYGSSPYGG